MNIKAFFDQPTYTLTYVVWDPQTRDTVVIDPVLDYDPAASKIDTTALREVISFLKSEGLKPQYVLETHAHADHLSGSQALKDFFPDVKVAIGERIKDVQLLFKGVFNLGDDFATDGRQFELLLKDNEVLNVGTLEIKTLFTPGHTPACASYLINGEAVFTGDALFMPDYGTGRCDFPAGDAATLFNSISERLYTLPDQVKVFVGHDYQPNGREVAWESSIGEEKEKNIQLKASTSKDDFVKFRTERDKTLDAPRLLLPSVQVNIDAGHLPEPEDNGTRYLKIPVRS